MEKASRQRVELYLEAAVIMAAIATIPVTIIQFRRGESSNLTL
jgi:hypothetical protein